MLYNFIKIGDSVRLREDWQYKIKANYPEIPVKDNAVVEIIQDLPLIMGNYRGAQIIYPNGEKLSVNSFILELV